MDAKQCTELEKGVMERSIVSPRWLAGSNSIFWYKRALRSEKYQFLLVNCETGTCRPAFDHGALASALGGVAEEQLNAENLPFHWINPDAGEAWVRFQYKDKIWNFSQDSGLEEWHGEFDSGNYKTDCDIKKPTPRNSDGQSYIVIANQLTRAITYYFINYEGSSDWQLGVVRARESKQFNSPQGTRLKITDAKGSKPVVLDMTRKSGIVNVEDSPEGLALRWEDDPLADVSSEPRPEEAKPRPKPEYELFTRKHNIWSRKDGIEKQVSFSGFEGDTFRSVSATPDGRFAVGMQVQVGSPFNLELKQSVPETQLRPKMKTGTNGRASDGLNGSHIRAGDHMQTSRPRLFDVEARSEIPVDDALFRNPFCLHGRGWSSCGTKYRFLFNERGHKHVRLLEMGLDGAVKVLVEESSDTVVDYNEKLWHKILPAANAIFWASERDGWNHIYRFSLEDGSLKNQVTKGEWLVKGVEFIDAKAEKIWFKIVGYYKEQEPYYEHLASINFDGSGLRVLTEGDGTHLWRFGPDRRYLIDSWSRVDMLPQIAVIDVSTGKQAVFLQKEELDSDEAENYISPERFVAKGRDGTTDIYGIIIRPSCFDPAKTYPVIERIYAHPFQFITPKHFRDFSHLRDRAGADYVVVMLDGMGTNWRSKAFLDVAYKNMRDGGFPDRIAWMRAAAAMRPWMDISRVGIHGGSAGGYNAAAAMLHHGDFYKAAVAQSANYDNRLGSAKWEEMYMSWPVDVSYEENSNHTHADKLRGALMLGTGELDDVVDPASTLHFADALIKADKDFELVIVPGVGHGLSSDWYDKKVARFFKRHLQDRELSANAAT
ncbi:hypothetical protein PWT90_08733 [Aphanocladium album]|nr:hypothetical protein PWT90_08733 [Aphanocladium album]